jgi:hypothetical protein
MRRSPRALVTAAVLLLCFGIFGHSRLEAQSLDPLAPPLVLGVSGNNFTINGTPRFLICVSYFAGLRASTATLDSDFEALSEKGFNCVRVFANWYYEDLTPPDYKNYMLMDDQGGLRESVVTRLRNLIGIALSNGLVVDLTFTRDTIARIKVGGNPQCMDFDDYRDGVAEAAERLADFDNVFFDMQNESNAYGSAKCSDACPVCITLPDCDDKGNCAKWYLNPNEGAQVAAAIRAKDPTRLLTISSTASHNLADYVRTPNPDLQIAAPHCCNKATWVADTAPWIRATRNEVGNGIPIYLQESNRCGLTANCNKTGSSNEFVNAALNARNAYSESDDRGARGWTLHNQASFQLHSGTLLSRMNSPAEIDALNRLADVLQVEPPAPPPPPPVLVSPPDGATTTTSPTFVWNAVIADPPVNNYKIQIRRSSDNVKVFGSFVGNVTSHTLASGVLSSGVTYKWRVRAFSPAGKSGWSPYRTLTTN